MFDDVIVRAKEQAAEEMVTASVMWYVMYKGSDLNNGSIRTECPVVKYSERLHGPRVS